MALDIYSFIYLARAHIAHAMLTMCLALFQVP